MNRITGWSPPPARPALESGDAAVWRLPVNGARPIETVLAKYLKTTPELVVLHRSPTGKPELEHSALHVSLAHSGQVALVAVSDVDVGVDVEWLRDGTEAWPLVAQALTSSEHAALQSLPIADRSEAFLSTWTRKEALLKAAGIGLALDPRLIELDEDAVVAAPPELGGTHDWTLAEVPLHRHAAAVALRGPLRRLLLYEWAAPCADLPDAHPASGA
jgi:4'-phosphopantetheinyl transferase